MKEDYLWDKTGGDAEIESLENALAAFRYRESAPPELPQKTFAVEKSAPPRRRFFRFGFAMAAGAAAAVLIVLSPAWSPVAENGMPAAGTVARIDAPPQTSRRADPSFAAPPAEAPVKAPENPSAATKPRVVKIRQSDAPVKIKRPKPAVPSAKRAQPPPPETLTAEEKYAYEQLMLALSITGSKLKIVQDKVRGIEERNAALESAK